MTLPVPDRARRCAAKNAVFVALIVFSNTFGNALLALSMTQMPSITSIAVVFSNIFFLTGTFLVALSTFAQLTMFTWADLSYVLPVTASGYVVTAFLGKYLLHENISTARWVGVIVISFGVFFVANTPPDTKHHDLDKVGAEDLEGVAK